MGKAAESHHRETFRQGWVVEHVLTCPPTCRPSSMVTVIFARGKGGQLYKLCLCKTETNDRNGMEGIMIRGAK